jgi:hypothetical protein
MHPFEIIISDMGYWFQIEEKRLRVIGVAPLQQIPHGGKVTLLRFRLSSSTVPQDLRVFPLLFPPFFPPLPLCALLPLLPPLPLFPPLPLYPLLSLLSLLSFLAPTGAAPGCSTAVRVKRSWWWDAEQLYGI